MTRNASRQLSPCIISLSLYPSITLSPLPGCATTFTTPAHAIAHQERGGSPLQVVLHLRVPPLSGRTICVLFPRVNSRYNPAHLQTGDS